jgi:Stress responsive A/B Barrel Domain
MIHRIVLYKLKPEVTPEMVEDMMMQTRMQLLKIAIVSNVRCGRRTEETNEWPFFLTVEFDSKERMAMFREDPIYIKFMEETIKPNTSGFLVLDYETDPKRK